MSVRWGVECARMKRLNACRSDFKRCALSGPVLNENSECCRALLEPPRALHARASPRKVWDAAAGALRSRRTAPAWARGRPSLASKAKWHPSRLLLLRRAAAEPLWSSNATSATTCCSTRSSVSGRGRRRGACMGWGASAAAAAAASSTQHPPAKHTTPNTPTTTHKRQLRARRVPRVPLALGRDDAGVQANFLV